MCFQRTETPVLLCVIETGLKHCWRKLSGECLGLGKKKGDTEPAHAHLMGLCPLLLHGTAASYSLCQPRAFQLNRGWGIDIARGELCYTIPVLSLLTWEGGCPTRHGAVWRNPIPASSPAQNDLWFPFSPWLRVGGQGWLPWNLRSWRGAAHMSQGTQAWATAWDTTSRLERKTPGGIRAQILMVILNCFCLSNIPF